MTLLREIVTAFRSVVTRFARDYHFALAVATVTAAAGVALVFAADASVVASVIVLGCLAIAIEFR